MAIVKGFFDWLFSLFGGGKSGEKNIPGQPIKPFACYFCKSKLDMHHRYICRYCHHTYCVRHRVAGMHHCPVEKKQKIMMERAST